MAEKFHISVPASTANLGPGFDSVGLALDRYLYLDVEVAQEWNFIFIGEELQGLTKGTDNLIYKVANDVAKKYKREMPACHVTVRSEIPLAKGMGSSASAIVAAIEVANQTLELKLTLEQVVREASLIEGHPDNVAASAYGGLVVGTHNQHDTFVMKQRVDHVDIIMLIPNEQLMTKKARSVLPQSLSYNEAVQASSYSNVLIAAILTGKWELAGEMMVRDLFHQPYRLSLVPGLEQLMKTVKKHGAYGAALSGAGPTLIVFAPKGSSKTVVASLKESFPNFHYEQVDVANEGVVVKHYHSI
ncbi:MAG: homoserine kinase [Bacillaceae bacterium]|nr:homoserine kinase [Bacillaceae bacterium]